MEKGFPKVAKYGCQDSDIQEPMAKPSFIDGTICEGTWQNGQLHGQNISYFKPGVGTFIGEFINGRRGQGIVKQL